MARQTNRETCKVRVIAIYRMLLSGKQMTCAQIREKLKSHYGIEVERKTVYDDIAAINRIMPIKSRGGARRRLLSLGRSWRMR